MPSDWFHVRRRDDAEMNDELGPGEYRAPRERNGTPNVTWRCPGCRRLLGLAKQHHDVRFDGTISPAVSCPHKDCNFVQWMFLEGWIPKSEGTA